MFKCPNCGKENPDNQEFCSHCGENLFEYKINDLINDIETLKKENYNLKINNKELSQNIEAINEKIKKSIDTNEELIFKKDCLMKEKHKLDTISNELKKELEKLEKRYNTPYKRKKRVKN